MSTTTKTQQPGSLLLEKNGEEKLKDIAAYLGTGEVSLIAGDILKFIPEIISGGDTDFLLGVLREFKKTKDVLALTDQHVKNDGSAYQFCELLKNAKTEEDIIKIFGQNQKVKYSKKEEYENSRRWKNTDLFVAYLNKLIKL